MKNYLVLIVMLSLIIGCGPSKPSSTTESGAQKDFIAQGMEYLKNKDIANAIHSFDSAIQQNPTEVENYLVLGEVYMRLQNYGGAVDTLNAAVRVNPNSGDAYYMLGLANALKASQEGDSDLGKASLAQAIEASKRSIDIYMQNRDEENFKKAVTFLQTLTPKQE